MTSIGNRTTILGTTNSSHGPGHVALLGVFN